MNAELLYEALNDRHSLEQLSEPELSRLVGSYPYFSIGQLLLAKKQRQTSSKESYRQQRENLHAFFRNPWWLYYQLELADLTATPAYVAQVPYRFEAAPAPFESIATGAAAPNTPPPSEPEVPTPSEPVTPMPSAPDAPAPPEPEIPTPSAPEMPAPSTPEMPAPSTPETPTPSGPEVLPPTVPAPQGPAVPSAPEMVAEEQRRHGFMPWPGMEEEEMDIPTLMGGMTHEVMTHEVEAHEHAAHEVPSHEPAAHEAEPEPTAYGAINGAINGATPHETTPIAEPFLPYMVTSAIAEAETQIHLEEPAAAPEAHLAAPEAPAPSHEPHAAGHVSAQEPHAPAPAPAQEPHAVAPLPPEEDPYDDPDATDGPADNHGSAVAHTDNAEPGAAPVHHLDAPAPAPAFPTGEPAPFPFSLTPLSHDFTFEPLHTVDYFASQGIKLDLEENPTDQLTRHLKSFTEWLKTMKRISPMEARHTDLDAATEAEIQQLASSANHQREAVLTESMAHVWVLQGKIHKAVEVYNKLSLQHPEKRAYFAAKIEQLNKL
jgi:hypothetical protein